MTIEAEAAAERDGSSSSAWEEKRRQERVLYGKQRR